MNKLLAGLIVLFCFSSMAYGQQDRVGIGTSSPQTTLDVKFPINITDTDNGIQLNASDRRWRMTVGGDKAPNGAYFQLLYKNQNAAEYTPWLTINHSNGNLGLGTTNPRHLLDLGESIGKKLAVYQHPSGDDFYGFGIGAGTLEFHASSIPSGGPAMTLTNAGRLGIGTGAPGSKLHIRGDQPGLIMESTNPLEASGGKEAISRITFRGQKNNVYRDAAIIEARQDATWSAGNPFFSPTALHFYTQSNGANGDELDVAKMVLTNRGALSVGHNSPQAAFHVKNSAGPGQHIALIENENADGSGLKIKINGNHGMWVPTSETAGFFLPKAPDPDALFIEPIIESVKARIMSGQPFQPIGTTDLIQILANNTAQQAQNLIDSLKLDKLLQTSICAGQEELRDFLGLSDLNPSDIPNALQAEINNLPFIDATSVDLPDFITNSTFKIPTGQVIVSGSPIDYCVRDPFTPSICWDSDPIKPGLQPIVDPLKLQVVTTNFTLPNLSNLNIPELQFIQNGFTDLETKILPDFLNGVDAVKNELAHLASPDFLISQLDCPNAPSPEEFLLSLPMPDPSQIINSLDNTNHFITFVDQGNRELGAIKAQSATDWVVDQISTTNLLELVGLIAGLVQPDGGAVDNLLSIVNYGYGWILAYNSIGVTYESSFGDYAEWLPRRNPREQISYGDIIGIRSGYISKDLTGAEQVMVVSKAPIIMGNAPDPDSVAYGNNVAFIGQVPVKVMGPVHSGDYMVADLEMAGFAKAVAPQKMTAEDFRYTVGRSWDTDTKPGFKFANTLVGMHNNAWVAPMQNTQSKVSELEAQVHLLKEQQAQQDQVLYQLVERVNSMSAESRQETSFRQSAKN